MSVFNDINTIWEYSQLTDIASKIKPYRSGSNVLPKYPLGKRRYSDRYFMPRLDLIPESEKHFYESGAAKWFHYYPGVPIEIYYTERYKLGTFHPDNTFEFNPSWGSYSQGDTGVVSAVLPGWISSKSQYGGLIFCHRQTRTQVPVYEGMRIRLCDGMPTENFELHVKTLDRKKTKLYRDKHDMMFKTGGSMLRAMGNEAIVKEVFDMVKGQVAPAYNYKHEDLSKAYNPDDPAGAVLWLALRYNINDCRYESTFSNSWSFRKFTNNISAESLLRSVKNYFYKEIYIQAIDRKEDVLKSKVYRYGDKLPTVEWGHKMFVNGVERKRLT